MTLRRAFRKRIAGRPLWNLARKSRCGSELGGLRPRAQNGMTVVSFPHGDVRSVQCFGASSAQYTNTLNPDHGSMLLDQSHRRAAPIGAGEATKDLTHLAHRRAEVPSSRPPSQKRRFLALHCIRSCRPGPRHMSGQLTASVERPHPYLGKGLRVFVLSNPRAHRNSEKRRETMLNPLRPTV